MIGLTSHNTVAFPHTGGKFLWVRTLFLGATLILFTYFTLSCPSANTFYLFIFNLPM